MGLIAETITPKQKELLEYAESTEGLHDHLRSVAEFCLAKGTETDGINAEMCNDLYFLVQLSHKINLSTK